MNIDFYVEQLKEVVSEVADPNWRIETPSGCTATHLSLRTPCYIAFFCFVEQAESLRDMYREAQEEIIRLKEHEGADWPRDLNLVLLVTGDGSFHWADARQEIIGDRYVCRKFVLNLNGGDLRKLLADLPFWSADDLLTDVATSVVSGVQDALQGYDQRLLADLASHSPGVERITQKIAERLYNLAGPASGNGVAAPPRTTPMRRTRLDGLDITDFRGIRSLRREDMPLTADVIFIYGPNGVGKTSIVDAVDWAVTGQIQRLKREELHYSRPDPVVNLLGSAELARVVCHFNNRGSITRTRHGRSTERFIESRKTPDDRATIDYVVDTKAPSSEARISIERLRDLFRGSHILTQHSIRRFLQETKSEDRFDILTNMIGAEEFVRFRQKSATVLQHVRSRLKTIEEKGTSLKHSLADLSRRLIARQDDLKKLTSAVTAGKAPRDLASELLEGLKSCQCPIDQETIEKNTTEPENRAFELLALKAETLIRAKKGAVEDLLVRVSGLEEGMPRYLNTQSQNQQLSTEIVNLKTLMEQARIELLNGEKTYRDIQIGVQSLRTKQAWAAGRYADFTWLKQSLPHYRELQASLQITEKSLAKQRGQFQGSQMNLEERQSALSIKRGRLQEIDRAGAVKTNRLGAILDLLAKLKMVEAAQLEVKQLTSAREQRELRMTELRQQAAMARTELDRAHSHLADAQKAYNVEVSRHDALSSVLVKLEQMTESPECPLCGRGFATAEEAKQIIRKHLSGLPLQLRDITLRLETAKKDIETKQERANSIANKIRIMETELQEVRSKKSAASEVVQEFITDCASQFVSLQGVDPALWRGILEQSLKECDTEALRSEAAIIDGEIRSCEGLVAEQQSVVEDLEKKISGNETQRALWASEIKIIETDMVKRGFEPHQMPNDAELALQQSETQKQTAEYNQQLANSEESLRAAESVMAGIRTSLKRADEDAASKETQLREYRTFSDHFMTACRAVGVNPEAPKESIGSVKLRASELYQSLSHLEEKRKVLEQTVAVMRLQRETRSLENEHDEIKHQLENTGLEKSHMDEWASRLKALEGDVTRKQLGAVSSHLKRLEPTTQQLYRRLNAHPVFGNIKFKTDDKTRQLNIEAERSLVSEGFDETAVSPTAFFSDAQLNTLAITVFLAGTLRQRWSGLDTILIDDPIQQMDEMNVYAFLDLIRGLSCHKQFIIFTCSRDFYLLAIEKLDCLNTCNQGSFLAYRLEGVAPSNLKIYRDVS